MSAQVLPALIQLSVAVTGVTLASLLVARCCRRSPVTRHALLLVGLVVLLATPGLLLLSSWLELRPLLMRPPLIQVAPAGSPFASGTAPASDGRAASLPAVPRVHSSRSSPRASPPQLPLFLLGLWLAGSAAALARLCAGSWRLRRLAAAALDVVEPRTQQQLAAACRRLGLERPPALMAYARLRSPISFGLWRPTIVLPTDLQDELSDDELAGVATDPDLERVLTQVAADPLR